MDKGSTLQNTLRIATFNIHKGYTHFNAHFSLHHQRDLLHKLNTDIVFLQEVQDQHYQHPKRFNKWPIKGQVNFLADNLWKDYRYGKNATYPEGHHGNALLSKLPIIHSENHDISVNALEQRGMLHCVIEIANWNTQLHCICLHLGLLANWRKQQLDKISHYIAQQVPNNAPLIVAGDFNDWSTRAGSTFANHLGLSEVFEHSTGKLARSFPAVLPILRLDRIYTRGLMIQHAQVHGGVSHAGLSDHAVLTASISRML